MTTHLRPVTFYNNVATSSDGSWKGVGGNYGGVQQRSIIGTKHTSDTVEVQVRINDGDFSVVCTATSWGVGATNFSTIIQGPFHDIRVRKIGTNGAASVIGLL